mgnify:CR=1 FL=1
MDINTSAASLGSDKEVRQAARHQDAKGVGEAVAGKVHAHAQGRDPVAPTSTLPAAAGPEDIQTFEFETNLATQNKRRRGKKRFKIKPEESVMMAGNANFGGTGSSTNTGGLSIPKSAA